MLAISLAVSGLLLLASNGIARRVPYAVAIIPCLGLAFVGLPSLFGYTLPIVAFHAFLLCAAGVGWRAFRRGPASFLALSLGATAVAYGVPGFVAWKLDREYGPLRSLYPFESMEARLPAPRAVPGREVVHGTDSDRLIASEEWIPQDWSRAGWLEMLHENAVLLFAESAGFGISRLGPPTEEKLARSLRDGQVPLQPGPRPLFEWSPGDLMRSPAEDEDAVGLMLRASIVDFVNPENFGYFKDRRHVAGFQAHRFSKVPASPSRWKVRNIELVGLLLKEEPRAYVSAELPRMDRPRDVPTRPLDRFEAFGLDCHGGERGALLGAFSYTLITDKP